MNKKNIVVLFGGQSSEHDVSCISAMTILNHINRDRYKVYPVGITKKGNWRLIQGEEIIKEKWEVDSVPAILSPDATDKSLLVLDEKNISKIKVDVVFPALHGLLGEDGSVQGLLELAKIPYVGCGILASSLSMDKAFTKIIVDTLRIRQAKHITVTKRNMSHNMLWKIEKTIAYPAFVKPSNAGSSFGITKAHNRDELIGGIENALKHSTKVLIEEYIKGREVECAVLGDDNLKVSGVGEIIAAAEFYDYDAKYNNDESKTIISPNISREIVKEIRQKAADIFRAVDGRGLARVDFFIEDKTNEVVFNEINTLPGFTSISMYPMLWEEKGISKFELVDELIQIAVKS